jgi:hypothetical protein
MGKPANPFPVPVLRREGHFCVQSCTPYALHTGNYGLSIFRRFARYARSRIALATPQLVSTGSDVIAIGSGGR